MSHNIAIASLVQTIPSAMKISSEREHMVLRKREGGAPVPRDRDERKRGDNVLKSAVEKENRERRRGALVRLR